MLSFRRPFTCQRTPTSPARAVETLRGIVATAREIQLFTYPLEMGEREAREAGLELPAGDDPTATRAVQVVNVQTGVVTLARGTIGWPGYPARVPSTLDFTTGLDENKHLVGECPHIPLVFRFSRIRWGKGIDSGDQARMTF